jgi:uncharacterized membrane protein YtjA (UPF0391 family)
LQVLPSFEYGFAGILLGTFALYAAISGRPFVEGGIMLYWALVFLVIALTAGILGFTGVAVAAAGIAKILFVIFLILFLISIVTHLARGATR